MAVSERNAFAIQLLLDGGADPDLATRIDERETPAEMAQAAGLHEIAAMLTRKGEPLRRRLRSGLTLLADFARAGEPVRRQRNYRIRLRLWLNKVEAVRWQIASGPVGAARLDDEGATLFTEVRNPTKRLFEFESGLRLPPFRTSFDLAHCRPAVDGDLAVGHAAERLRASG